MKKIRLDLSPIELRTIIISHGWYALKPFFASTNPLMLSSAFNIDGNKCLLQYELCDKNFAINVAHNILSLNVDTTCLYQKLSADPTMIWLSNNKIEKFLKSPTLFEDCCKAILATNATFNRTISMIENLWQFDHKNS
jgi:hypothetical protein